MSIINSIATIGFFDGVHKGHQFLFHQLRQAADQRGLSPVIVTFRQHPRQVLQSDYIPQLLTSTDERIALIEQVTGIQPTVLDFTAVNTLTAGEFLHLLNREYHVTTLLMGYDHRFGSDRLRHPHEYKAAGEREGVEVVTMSEFTEGEMHVSSTEIRQDLEHGNILVANELLGRPYQLTGTVVHGKGIGRNIGFPTANIQPNDPCKIIPKSGVYKVKVNGELPALLNIGTNPTVGNSEQTIEVHIPNWKGNLYDSQITICFERYIREERKFESLDALREQIEADFSIVLGQGR